MRWQDPRVPTWADLLAQGRSLLSSPSVAPYEAEELLASAAGRPRAWFHARRRDEADAGDACAVLAAIMLFLEKEREFFESVIDRSVLS